MTNSQSPDRAALADERETIADIYAYEDGIAYSSKIWPLDCGVAIILCPDCGEIDANGQIYSNLWDPAAPRNHGCIGCKSTGLQYVGL